MIFSVPYRVNTDWRDRTKQAEQTEQAASQRIQAARQKAAQAEQFAADQQQKAEKHQRKRKELKAQRQEEQAEITQLEKMAAAIPSALDGGLRLPKA